MISASFPQSSSVVVDQKFHDPCSQTKHVIFSKQKGAEGV
jgi:hypothetical protein